MNGWLIDLATTNHPDQCLVRLLSIIKPLINHFFCARSVDGLFEDAGCFFGLWSHLRILRLLNRHHVECVERCKHRATNPSCILSMQGSTNCDFSLCISTGKRSDFKVKPFLEVSHKSCATRQDNIVVQGNLEVWINFPDWLVGQLSDATSAILKLWMSYINNVWVEHALSSHNSLAMWHLNDLLVR